MVLRCTDCQKNTLVAHKTDFNFWELSCKNKKCMMYFPDNMEFETRKEVVNAYRNFILQHYGFKD